MSGYVQEEAYTLAEAASFLEVKEMTVLCYILYSKVLPTHKDSQGNYFLLLSELERYRAKHQKPFREKRRSRYE